MTVIGHDFSSFGALLNTFRKRACFTQQVLAEIIGVHRRTLVRWEQGDALPGSKALVLELGRYLKLDNQETRQFLEASLTARTPYWSVPFPRNLFFTGRKEILEVLHMQLSGNKAVALTQSSALHGLGGVGKTQVALEYAYRYALEYSAVFWIAAETQGNIMTSLQHVAEVLQLPERVENDQQRVVAATLRWLSTHGQWLLICDNVEDLSLLDHFLPANRPGAILLTTRYQILGTFAQGLDLLPMEYEEGVLFLLHRAKLLKPEPTSEQMWEFATSTSAHSPAAAELVKAVGGLPLALDQAGAYLEATQCGLSAYLELFRTQRASLLASRGDGAREHPESVSTTFQLAIATAEKLHPALGDLLRVCAFLQADAIPEELFLQGSKYLGVELANIASSEMAWNHLMACACGYSLLARQPEYQTVSIHRLVQAVLLDTMTETERQLWKMRAIQALDAVFPEVQPVPAFVSWKQSERVLSHALLCLQRSSEDEEDALVLASLASKSAHYLREHGRYAQAEPLYQRALCLRERVLGPRHPEVACSLTELGVIFWQQGRYAEAEPLLQGALHIWRHASSQYQLEIARPLNSLAILSWHQGNYLEAERLFHQAFRIREQVLGPNHPLVATPLNNLADLYLEWGKEREAEPLYQHTLHIWEQSLGSDHPWVAEPLHGLANLCRDQGKEREAEQLYQRAWHIREHHLGQHHPETVQLLYDLALLRRGQGRGNEAFSLVEQACSIYSQSLGETHPQTVAAHTLSAQLLQEQVGEQKEASFERSAQASSHALADERQGGRTSLACAPHSHSNDDPFQNFLDTCCNLHPHAWCRSADLWQCYQQWSREYQQRYPLSRGAFIVQLKAHGCRADRTKTARIWRGIALVETGDDGR